MLRTTMSVMFLTAFLTVTPFALSAATDAEKCAKSTQCEKGQCEKGQCEKGQCEKGECEKGQCEAGQCTAKKSESLTASSDACASKTCPSGVCANETCQTTASGYIQVTTKLEAGSEASGSETQQCRTSDQLVASEICLGEAKVCCAAEGLVASHDQCCSGSDCPAALVSATLTSAECQCGEGCGCCSDAEQQCRHKIVALHWQLMTERAKSAVLAAQLKQSEASAKAQVEFAKQMLKKEVEIVQLHAQLQLSTLRIDAGHEVAGKAMKAANAELAARVAELENRLESITVRLATKPTTLQTK